MKAFLLSALLILGSCKSLHEQAGTYPLGTAYALAEPMAERVIDWSDESTESGAEAAVSTLDTVAAELLADPDKRSARGGMTAVRLITLADVHDLLMSRQPAMHALDERVWLRSSSLLRTLVSTPTQN